MHNNHWQPRRMVWMLLAALLLCLTNSIPVVAARHQQRPVTHAGHAHRSHAVPANSASLYGVGILTATSQFPRPGTTFIPYATYSQMGASWVRIEIILNAPAHTLDDSKTLQIYQSAIAQLHAAGLKVLALLDYGTLPAEYDALNVSYPWQCFLQIKPSVSCLGFVGTPQEYDNDMAHQASILANLGPDAPDAFEVWNEPDNSRWYVPPINYTGLYSAVQAAVHAVAGSGPVVTGGLVTAIDMQTPGKLGSWASQTTVYATADAVGLHPYGYVSQNYCQCYPRAGWLDTVNTSWIAFLRAQGNPNASLWFTEYNYTADSTQNNPLDRALGIQDVYSWAKVNNIRVFWFNAQDYPPTAPYSGIFNADGTPVTLSSPVPCGGPQTTEEAVYQASAAGLC
jgi:hypothetical protein